MTTLQETTIDRWIVVDSCRGELHHFDNIEYDQVNTCRCGAYVLTRDDAGLVHVGPCDYGLACKLGKH